MRHVSRGTYTENTEIRGDEPNAALQDWLAVPIHRRRVTVNAVLLERLASHILVFDTRVFF